uniref:SCR-like protein n=1 Tax=Leavenworthia alabamica TaxID=310722 RepID=A0A2Z4HJG3_LEAAL|nr:SCR-like protein [Leavenworthia alabamica]
MRCAVLLMVSYVLMSFLISHAQDVENKRWKRWCNISAAYPGQCGDNGNKQCKQDLKNKNPYECSCGNKIQTRICHCTYCL